MDLEVVAARELEGALDGLLLLVVEVLDQLADARLRLVELRLLRARARARARARRTRPPCPLGCSGS